MDKLLDFGFQNIDLWRSEEMELVRLLIPSESAHDTVAALGEVGLLQFKDMNTEKSAFQRTYANQVGQSRGSGRPKGFAQAWRVQMLQDIMFNDGKAGRWQERCRVHNQPQDVCVGFLLRIGALL